MLVAENLLVKNQMNELVSDIHDWYRVETFWIKYIYFVKIASFRKMHLNNNNIECGL